MHLLPGKVWSLSVALVLQPVEGCTAQSSFVHGWVPIFSVSYHVESGISPGENSPRSILKDPKVDLPSPSFNPSRHAFWTCSEADIDDGIDGISDGGRLCGGHDKTDSWQRGILGPPLRNITLQDSDKHILSPCTSSEKNMMMRPQCL